MALTVTHSFFDGHADGLDATLVRPSNWNDTHSVAGTVDPGQLPTPTTTTLGGVFSNAGAPHKWLSSINADGSSTFTQPSFSDILGTVSMAFANPTAVVGLTVANGSAVTAMRSDAAPALSTGIAPTWTGAHTFGQPTTFNGAVTANSTLAVSGAATLNGAVTANSTLAVAGQSTLSGPVFCNALTSFNAITAYEVNGWGYIAPGVHGVVGNGSADDTAAIQAILNTYNNVFIDAGKYLISSTITISCQNPARIIRGAGSQFAGGSGIQNGAFFIAAASFSGTAAILISSSAGNSATYSIGGFSISNHTAGSGASYGVEIASPGGGTKNHIHDIISTGFAFGFLVINSRLIVFDRCASWNVDLAGTSTTGNFGWYIVANSSNFCGDMDLESCQTVADRGGTGIAITDQGSASATLAGFRFRNHTHYNGVFGLSMNVSGTNSLIGDVWVNPGCQFEGQASPAYGIMCDMVANAAGAAVRDIHIDGVYGSGFGWNKHVQGTVSGGSISSVFVVNNFFPNPQQSGAIYFAGTGGDCRGITVSNNQIVSPGAMGAGGIGIYIENVFQATVNGNTISGGGAAISWLCQFTGGGGPGPHVATGNNGGLLCSNVPCVQDISGAPGAINTNY